MCIAAKDIRTYSDQSEWKQKPYLDKKQEQHNTFETTKKESECSKEETY